MKFQPFGRLFYRFLLVSILFLPTGILVGQSVAPDTAVPDDAAKRLEWLRAHVGAAATAQPTPPVVKKRFADTHAPTLRSGEAPPADPGVKKSPPVEKTIADTPPANPRPAEPRVAEPTPKKTRVAAVATPPATPRAPESPAATPRSKIARATATPAMAPRTPAPRIAEKATPPVAPHTPAPRIAEKATPTIAPHTPAPRIAEKATPSATPHTPAPRIVEKATPTPTPRRNEALSLDTRITDIHLAPRQATPAPQLLQSLPPAPVRPGVVAGRYPWKTSIVTTVFWIGEPVGGHNFTPNCSSSWDAHWTQSYGGYDNPNPEARRNFLPANFTPRQNPFYVALPFNDVTRGTTKPESRVVIPWFREAFRQEGQSICRDRWVAIRSRNGRVSYAQWSDCGPFRTDHWQYVFGNERPKPNLNQGAGLDVSPAVRDYLGLQSTDVTDWKFVDAKDVPSGPWALYGENNPFAQRTLRPGKGLPKSDVPEIASARSR